MRWLLVLLLAACAPKGECPKPVPVKVEQCPKPPEPDECVAAWYAKADTPRCVDAWIDKLADHRQMTKHKARK